MFSSKHLLCVFTGIVFFAAQTRAAVIEARSPDHDLRTRQAQPASGQLRDFAVYPPVLVPEGTSNENGCIHTQSLVEYTFGNSYGSPFVGNYTPPPCDFNRVIINLTVTSSGRQFDRLGIVYLGDIEIFRTSTAEPTTNGIIWNYVKEMQQYNSLWKQPQKIIFDEGNIINDEYTGYFHTSLTATFFTVPDSPATADLIVPISAKKSMEDQGSVFTVPSDNASVAYILPTDTTRAVVSLSGCGQSNEEFWYSDAPTSEVDTFAATSGALLPGGTFREIQLLIDGQLSGVSWPFPVIFTGGIVPGFWRPIFGIDAIDLRQHEIDITPWLGHLLDGKPHTFEIRVASVNDNGHSATLAETPGTYWLVSGTIFIYRNAKGLATKGTAPTISTPPIDLKFDSSYTTVNGTNTTLTYSTNVTRSISISSFITIGDGSSIPASWTQKLTYTNYNHLTSYGAVQVTSQLTQGLDVASGARSDASDAFSHSYSYPLWINSSYTESSDGSSLTLQGNLTRGKQLLTLGNPVFPTGLQNFNTSAKSNEPTFFSVGGGDNGTSQVLAAGAASYLLGKNLQGTIFDTTQVAVAEYHSSANSSSSFGTTEQWLDLRGAGSNGQDLDVELYSRHVKAVNLTVVEDDSTLIGQSYTGPSYQVAGSAGLTVQPPASVGGVRQYLGRGPGKMVGQQ